VTRNCCRYSERAAEAAARHRHQLLWKSFCLGSGWLPSLTLKCPSWKQFNEILLFLGTFGCFVWDRVRNQVVTQARNSVFSSSHSFLNRVPHWCVLILQGLSGQVTTHAKYAYAARECLYFAAESLGETRLHHPSKIDQLLPSSYPPDANTPGPIRE
jgi:hypothetical protein